MSNNNNKPGYQQSPNKYQQQHYSRPEQKERSYQERRNDFQPYPIQYSDPNQGNRNALQEYSRMRGYSQVPPNYYPPPPMQPYGHSQPLPYGNPMYMPAPRGQPYPQGYYCYPPHPQNYQNYRQSQPRYYEGRQDPKNAYGNDKFQQRSPEPKVFRRQSEKDVSPVIKKNSQRFDESPEKRQRRRERLKNQSQSQHFSQNSAESNSQQSQQEEVYYKKKVINKRKDPVLDSKEEIRKWIQARRRNYPRRIAKSEERKTNNEQISILEKRIRKKLILINSDPRNLMKKQKDLDILRRFILHPRRQRRVYNKVENRPTYRDRPLIEEIEANNIPVLEPELEVKNQVEAKESIEVVAQSAKKCEKQSQEEGDMPAVELPINSADKVQQNQKKQFLPYKEHRKELSVEVIINHLQMKQRQDSKSLQNLMDYKSNGFQYHYQYQTLETNLLLDNIFRDTSYMLQSIRYIVKNNFFD